MTYHHLHHEAFHQSLKTRHLYSIRKKRRKIWAWYLYTSFTSPRRRNIQSFILVGGRPMVFSECNGLLCRIDIRNRRAIGFRIVQFQGNPGLWVNTYYVWESAMLIETNLEDLSRVSARALSLSESSISSLLNWSFGASSSLLLKHLLCFNCASAPCSGGTSGLKRCGAILWRSRLVLDDGVE